MAGEYRVTIRMTSRGSFVNDLKSGIARERTQLFLAGLVQAEGEAALEKFKAATPVSERAHPHMIDNWALVRDGLYAIRVVNNTDHSAYPFSGVKPHWQHNLWGKGISFFHPGYPPNPELNAAQAEIVLDVRTNFREVGGRGAATAITGGYLQDV